MDQILGAPGSQGGTGVTHWVEEMKQAGWSWKRLGAFPALVGSSSGPGTGVGVLGGRWAWNCSCCLPLWDPGQVTKPL